MTTLFTIFWPFTSKLKFFFCTLMLIPLLMVFGYVYQSLGGLTLLQDASVPHPDNHWPEIAAHGFTLADVDACPPFHNWKFINPATKRGMTLCNLGNHDTGKPHWLVKIFAPDGKVITNIPKFKMVKITDVVRYAYNSGYQPEGGWTGFLVKVIAEFGN